MRMLNARPERMNCMEIWGGNRTMDNRFEAPGLDIFLHSVPYGGSGSGGDIYYVTSCASGRISRLLLADVSGHGDAASRVATELRDLLRANVNRIRQDQFVAAMNQRFGEVSDAADFATAVVATFFLPSKQLTIGLAGHPHPLYYSAEQQRWMVIVPPKDNRQTPTNLPLGVIKEATYPSKVIKTSVHDMFLLYSDAYIEAKSGDESMIGIAGLLEILNQRRGGDPVDVIPHLRESIAARDGGNLSSDDATLILGHVTESKTRWRDNLLAPFRIFQKARDRTAIEDCC